MKTHKDTHGMYLLQSVDPEKLGKEQKSKGGNTRVTYVYGSRVYSKAINWAVGNRKDAWDGRDTEWMKRVQEVNTGTKSPFWLSYGNTLRGNFLTSLKGMQIKTTPSNGEYKVLAHFLSWKDMQW